MTKFVIVSFFFAKRLRGILSLPKMHLIEVQKDAHIKSFKNKKSSLNRDWIFISVTACK